MGEDPGKRCVGIEEMSQEADQKKSNCFKQLSATVALSSAMLSNGLTVGYPAVALPAMQANSSVMIITDHQASWVASLPQLTTLVGCLCVGPLMDRFGRKPGILLATVTSSIGWLLLGVTSRILWVYLGRLLCGLGMGLASTGVSVLLAELADSALRAPITMARNIFFSIGLTLVYSLGLAFKRDWQTLGTVCSALSILSTVLVLAFVPESNVWKNTKKQNKSSLHLDWTHLWRSRRRPEIYKPGLFICIFFFVRQLAGTSVILTYAVSISGAAGVSVDPYIVAVGLGCGRTVAGLVAAGVSARWGRRPPVTYAGCLMSLTMIWIAHNAPEETPAPTQSPSDLYSRIAVPALLIIFVLSSTIASDIPRSMASEIFPTDVRGMATSVGLCVTYMSSFVALKMYPELLSGLGRKGLFTFYAVLSVGSTVWTILLLPETHGKTLEEIEAIYTDNQPRTVEPERHPLHTEERRDQLGEKSIPEHETSEQNIENADINDFQPDSLK